MPKEITKEIIPFLQHAGYEVSSPSPLSQGLGPKYSIKPIKPDSQQIAWLYFLNNSPPGDIVLCYGFDCHGYCDSSQIVEALAFKEFLESEKFLVIEDSISAAKALELLASI
ncbi:MAG: hypothetical protein ABIH72_00105 [archaeon]